MSVTPFDAQSVVTSSNMFGRSFSSDIGGESGQSMASRVSHPE